jgi:hypothetical protein
MANDLSRETVILILVGGWWGTHGESMSHYEENAQAARQVDNALEVWVSRFKLGKDSQK